MVHIIARGKKEINTLRNLNFKHKIKQPIQVQGFGGFCTGSLGLGLGVRFRVPVKGQLSSQPIKAIMYIHS